MQAYQARRRQINVKGLLIQPELEEIAKYGAKIPPWPEQEELSLLMVRKAWFRSSAKREQMRAEGRLLVLAVMFAFGFAILIFQYWLLVVAK